MKKSLLIILFVMASIRTYADYGNLYYFDCVITTNDKTVKGYFIGPYELLQDDVLECFLKDTEFFQSKVLTDLMKGNQTSIDLHAFVYIHDFEYQSKTTQALYRSEEKMSIFIKDIVNINLKSLLTFHFCPISIISKISANDTTWLKKKTSC